jgi:hypothetical protein
MKQRKTISNVKERKKVGYSIYLYKVPADTKLTEETMLDIVYESNLEECTYTHFSLGNRDSDIFQKIFNIHLANNENSYFKIYDSVLYQQAKEKYNSININNVSLSKRIELFINELEQALNEDSKVFFCS